MFDNQFAKIVRQKIEVALNHEPPAGNRASRSEVLKSLPGGKSIRVYNGASENRQSLPTLSQVATSRAVALGRLLRRRARPK